MPEPESVRDAFARVDPLVKEVQRYVRSTLEPYCRKNKYLFIDRVKTSESLGEKLEGGRVERWSDIDDLYACTIVVPSAGHESGVVRKLDASFTKRRTRTRSESMKAPDVFRFDGSRWYGVIDGNAAAQRQPGLDQMQFEVQVVTAFEYAWIAVTHDLVYKADTVDWRRQRLAAQLKAAVEQVEVLIAAFESASVAVVPSPWPETELKELIVVRCQTLLADGLIPDTIVPLSWRRFADNVYALINSYESNRHRMNHSVEKLLSVIESDLRGANPVELPVSGTLFQYVQSVVSRESTAGSLASFVTVPSRELSDLYGVRSIPTQFVFDGVATETAPPEMDLAGGRTAVEGAP